MPSLKLVFRGLVAVAGFAASAAFAAGQPIDLNVSATITGTCMLTSVPAMSFTLDPTSTADGLASSTVLYKCTKGTAPTSLTVGGASAATGYSSGTTAPLKGAITGNTDVLPYTISWTNPTAAGTGLGTGITAQSVTLNGKILNSDFVNATPDTYSAKVPVSINP